MKHAFAMALAACLLAQAPCFGQDAKAGDANAAKSSGVVPIEILKSKHVAVQVKINDKGPFRVIFDTGAPVTLVSNNLAEKADLLSEREKRAALGFFGAKPPKKVKKLQIGDLVIENTEVMIMDHPLLKVASKVLGPLDGIVGFPFFSRYKMTIDYQNEQMTFEPSDYKGSGGYVEMMMGLMLEDDPRPKKKIQAPGTLWGFAVAAAQDADPGVLVDLVLPGTPASAAGLKAGDRLLVLDGTWTDSVQDFYRAAGHVDAGQKAIAKVRRDGQELEIVIVPKVGL